MRWRRRRDTSVTTRSSVPVDTNVPADTSGCGVDPMAWAQSQWEAGALVPNYLTGALGYLTGPNVDLACGTTEPHVDLWEAGQEYPTWTNVLLLAMLCRVHPAQLMRRPTDPTLAAAIPKPTPTPVVSCLRQQLPIMEFEPHALPART